MYLYRVTFGKGRKGGPEVEKLVDLAETYLCVLTRNGQVCGDYCYAWTKGVLTVYLNLPRPNAVKKRHHCKWGRKHLTEVTEAFGAEPVWELLDDDVPKRFPSWKSASALYLSSHAFTDAPPVRRMDDGWGIPAYLLPLSDREREDLYCWSRSYAKHDDIWIGSGVLEIPAYKQLVEPTSDLSQEGLGLCALIEQKTSIPTYYYLMRHWGRRVGEEKRICPLCGRKWRVRKAGDDNAPFWRFPFRCDRCRLVSNDAYDQTEPRHARIGEYRKPRRK